MSVDTVEGVPIEARDVAIRFGELEVVSGIDLDIRPGEFVCLLGPVAAASRRFCRPLPGS